MNAGLPKLLLTFIGFVIIFKTASSQALYPVTLDEKVKHSPVIVEGMVESQFPFWNKAHTMIFTSSKVRVYKVFAGSVSTDYIQVLTQGGSVDNFNVQVSELLQLETGTSAMFFCFPNELKMLSPVTGEILYDVYASAQGCYKYDVTKMAGDVPFEWFSSITTGLYPAITSRTGKSFINKVPAVSFILPVATAGIGLDAVTNFSPKVVNAGALLQPDSNLLTISGAGFGAPTGSAAILFDNADNGTGGSALTLAATSKLIVSWTDSEIKVKVPAGVGTGLFSVRNAGGTLFSSGSVLTINYAVSTASFTVNAIMLQSNLMNTNGQGGYDVVYSTNTAGGGRNLNSAPEKETFQRALSTWKQVCGANIREAGTTTNQVVTSNDNINTVVRDNTNTTVPVLASGTLAITYSYNVTCTLGGAYNYPAQKTGFDILIRNNSVSAGSTNLTAGPCPPSNGIVQYDLETVILHELGHAFNLGHINDTYQGSSLPNINPPKLMNYSIPNGVKRTSPDFSAKTGAAYTIGTKGLAYGLCAYTSEMTPLSILSEPKDECPLTFPVAVTPDNTQVDFDLVHATSNFHTDPQYTAINCLGQGTGVTNTAYYVIKTNNEVGALTISVSNYATSPVAQANCTIAGIELGLYRLNTCPAGQNFPDPVACRMFNADGILANFTSLEQNATYVLMVDGIANTKANFTLAFNGAVLPVKIKNFYGNIADADNLVHWDFDAFTAIAKVNLERSNDGHYFETISSWSSTNFDLTGNYTDKKAPAIGYYRLVFYGSDGKISYSNVINLSRRVTEAWRIYPNPAKNHIGLFATNVTSGRYTTHLYTSTGMLVSKQVTYINSASQNISIASTGLSSGNYRLVVTGQNGERVYSTNVNLVK